MKKLVFLLVLIPFLWTCKKGEKDPIFSFRTRKARVVGEWTMKKGSASITINQPPGSPFNQDFKMDGSKATINETESGSTPYIYIIAYTFNINFKADGTFTARESFGINLLEASGKWNFTGRIGEAKNKENIVLKIDRVDRGYTRNNLFNKTGTEVTYQILELRNKIMTIRSSSKPYIDANGKYATFSCEYGLEQR